MSGTLIPDKLLYHNIKLTPTGNTTDAMCCCWFPSNKNHGYDQLNHYMFIYMLMYKMLYRLSNYVKLYFDNVWICK